MLWMTLILLRIPLAFAKKAGRLAINAAEKWKLPLFIISETLAVAGVVFCFLHWDLVPISSCQGHWEGWGHALVAIIYLIQRYFSSPPQ
jgi:hypothetical protein